MKHHRVRSSRCHWALTGRVRGTLPLFALLLATSVPATSWAQVDLPPERGGFTRSMGIPSMLRFSSGFEAQWNQPTKDSRIEALANLGISRYLGNPTAGIAALSLEGYLGARGADFVGGARAHLLIPSLQCGVGVDQDFKENDTDLVLRLDLPIRRSGIVGFGSTLSVRYLPTRAHTFGIGMTFPLGDGDAGRTRPQRDAVELDDRRPQRLNEEQLGGQVEQLRLLVSEVRERALWVARLSQPFVDVAGSNARAVIQPTIERLRAHIDSTDARFPRGHGLNEEIRAYHDGLERAFSYALSLQDPQQVGITAVGQEVARHARRFLLDDVIYPYNHLYGQLKKNDSLYGMIAVAQTDFARWLLADSNVERQFALPVFYVFQSLCDIVDANRQALADRWEDNRNVWLPLQYGLRPEDHDSQAELDDILAKATQADFSVANRFWYIINEEFQYEMARSVRLAEDYHVLWIHDVSGYDHNGDPDAIAYEQVRNYLLAMTERVRRYDDTGRLPMYIIFLDQHFFQANGGQLWMRLLEEPLDHHIDLPKKFKAWQEELEKLQADLRQAVESSTMLRLERSQFGRKWLKNRIKVHVNITNPADPSFFSSRVVGRIQVPDNHMRDHRKIVFYDVSEDDPYRGKAMFTGMGIGEHYVGADWEDRAVMLQGPAALATKTAARSLLTVQGFAAEDMPYPLRARPLAPDYQQKIDAEIQRTPRYMLGTSGVLQVHNGTGFTPKPVSVAKAVLYSLMPPGSLLKIPDSLWQSYSFASLLAGSALRGCRVLIIAPSLRAAPSAGSLQMSRAHGLMSRLVVFGESLDDVMQAQGGILKVGLYAPKQGVGDLAGRMRQAVELKVPWSGRVYNFHPSIHEVASNAQGLLDSLGYQPEYLDAKDSLATPKLHLKANLMVSGPAWEKLSARPEWGGILREYIVYLARQQGSSSGEHDVLKVPEELARRAGTLIERFVETLSEEERQQTVLYLTAGSVNMDYRSQMMNGEVMIVLSGLKSMIGSLDFILLTGLCEWMDSTEDVDALLPAPGWWTRKIADFVKIAL